jgi:hypothetical protein
MQSEIQSRDDAEVAAATADCPEQVLVPAGPKLEYVAICGHELRSNNIVARRSIEAACSRIAAGEREPCNSNVTASAHRRDEPSGQSGRQQILDSRSTSNRRHSSVRIDFDSVECGEVNLYRAIGNTESGIAVPATADRDRNIVPPRELHAAPHVVNISAARHCDRMTIVREVPDFSCVIEERRPGAKKTPMDFPREIIEVWRRWSFQPRALKTVARTPPERSCASGGDRGSNEVATGPARDFATLRRHPNSC